MLGLGAQVSSAATTVQVAVANNVYPAMRELASSGWLNSQGPTPPGVTAFTSDAAAQSGGFWRADNSTTLRGITSGNLRKQLLGSGPYTAPGAACSSPSTACTYGPLQIDAFFSADEGNVDQVIPTADGGSCTTGSGLGQGGENITACPGIAATKTPFTVGRLAIYTCNSSWATVGDDPGSPGAPVGADSNNSGNGVPASPRCEASPVSLGTNDMAGVIGWLQASTSHKLSIALPSSAPFGAAARQALITAGAAHSPSFTYDDSSGTSAQNAFPAGTGAGHCEGTLPSGAHCQIRLESGISQVRGAVTSGTTQLGIAALSNLKHISWTSGTNGPNGVPGGGDDLSVPSDDPNTWYAIPESAYSDYGRILQYAVGIERSTPDSAKEAAAGNILADIQDSTPQAVFANYGYEPLP